MSADQCHCKNNKNKKMKDINWYGCLFLLLDWIEKTEKICLTAI